MLSLIKAELYKIISKKIVIIGLICVFLMNLVLYINWAFPPEDSISIAEDKEYFEQFDGKLTDEKVEKIHSDIISDDELSEQRGNSALIIFNDRFATGNDERPVLTVEEAFSNGYDSDVADSLVWGYSEGWANIISVILSSMIIIGFVVIIGISPVFADEYTSGMDSLILTSRYGKTKSIYSKLAASIIFSVVLVIASIIMLTALFTINYGFSGWNASVQLSSLGLLNDVPYVMTFGQAYLIMCAVWIVAEAALTAFICIISAVSRSSFIALIISFLVYILPIFCAEILAKLGIPTEILSVANIISIMPNHTLVVSQYLYLIVIGIDFVICVAGIILPKIVFSRHQVR